MATITRGNIPAEVIYICRKEQKTIFTWEGDTNSSEAVKSRTVIPAYISDAANKKTIETGERWASHRFMTNSDVPKYTYPNTPVVSVEVVSIEKRTEGGRAYKCIVTLEDGKQFWVDLREDVLLETMVSSGVSKGGFLVGQFVWARVGSDMKLVRVGSELHARMAESTTLGKKPKISDYEIGGVYKTKTGQEWIYCGKVNTVEATDTTDPRCYYLGGSYSFSCLLKRLNGANLWFKKSDSRNVFQNTISHYQNNIHAFVFADKKAVVEKSEQLTLPDNFLNAIRHAATVQANAYEKNERYKFSLTVCYAALANMVSVDQVEPVETHPIYKSLFERFYFR